MNANNPVFALVVEMVAETAPAVVVVLELNAGSDPLASNGVVVFTPEKANTIIIPPLAEPLRFAVTVPVNVEVSVALQHSTSIFGLAASVAVCPDRLVNVSPVAAILLTV
jgi:hypothetical protein